MSDTKYNLDGTFGMCEMEIAASLLLIKAEVDRTSLEDIRIHARHIEYEMVHYLALSAEDRRGHEYDLNGIFLLIANGWIEPSFPNGLFRCKPTMIARILERHPEHAAVVNGPPDRVRRVKHPMEDVFHGATGNDCQWMSGIRGITGHDGPWMAGTIGFDGRMYGWTGIDGPQCAGFDGPPGSMTVTGVWTGQLEEQM